MHTIRKNDANNVGYVSQQSYQQHQQQQHQESVLIEPSLLTLYPISDDNICCTCLSQTTALRSIHKMGKISGKITKLSEMLTEIVGENYSENGGLPGTICDRCVLHISKAYSFKQQCIISHHKLKEKLKYELFDLDSSYINNKDGKLNEIEDKSIIDVQCINKDNLKDIIQAYVPVQTKNVSALDDKTSDSSNLVQLPETINIVKNADDAINIQKTTSIDNDGTVDYLDYNDDQDDAGEEEEQEQQEEDVVILIKYDTNLEDGDHHPTYTYKLCNKVNDKNDENVADYDKQPQLSQQQQQSEPQQQQQQQELENTEETIEYYNIEETDKDDSIAYFKTDDEDGFNDDDNANSVNDDIPKMVLPGYRIRAKNSKKPKVGVYECLECGKILSNYHSHRYHLQLHSDATPFLCSQCGEGFKTRNAYDGHMITHAEINPHTCDICFKSYRQAASLRCHKLTHTGEKPFLCGLCGKGMTQKSGFKKHMRTHTGEKPFECEFCKKSFRYSGNLIMHKRTHTGEKPYLCEFCEKAFTGCEQLKRHRLTHTGEKPFKCEICNKGFCRRSVLKAHLKVHDNSGNFSCTLCPSYFTKLSLLSSHTVRAHKSSLIREEVILKNEVNDDEDVEEFEVDIYDSYIDGELSEATENNEQPE